MLYSFWPCVSLYHHTDESAQWVAAVLSEMIPKPEWLTVTSLYMKLTANHTIMSH